MLKVRQKLKNKHLVDTGHFDTRPWLLWGEVSCVLKNLMLNSNPQSYSIRKWGLWGMIRPRRQSPMNKYPQEMPAPLSDMCGHSKESV